MKNVICVGSVLTYLASAGALAGAPTGIVLGQPILGGTGCPVGTASAALSPDGTSLSILFDSFEIQAGGTSGNAIDRKNCDIAIPLGVPGGYSVSVLQVDYRGYNALPAGAQSEFSVDYFFAGSQGPGFQHAFYGPLNTDYDIGNQLTATAMVWSACGTDVNLRINSSMTVQTNSLNQQAIATVDSADVQSALVYQLQWKQCGGGYPPAPPAPAPYPPAPPVYPPAPPQPTPPLPGSGYEGNCTIIENMSTRQWLVRDIHQNLIGTETTYQAAVTLAEESDADGRCLGSTPSPYPPSPYPPSPYPPSPYPPARATCQVTTPYGSWVGTGSSQGQATAAARDQCLRAVNNSNICNAGSVTCRQ